MLVSGLLGARKPPPRQLPCAPPAQAAAGLARRARLPQLALPAATRPPAAGRAIRHPACRSRSALRKRIVRSDRGNAGGGERSETGAKMTVAMKQPEEPRGATFWGSSSRVEAARGSRGSSTLGAGAKYTV